MGELFASLLPSLVPRLSASSVTTRLANSGCFITSSCLFRWLPLFLAPFLFANRFCLEVLLLLFSVIVSEKYVNGTKTESLTVDLPLSVQAPASRGLESIHGAKGDYDLTLAHPVRGQ